MALGLDANIISTTVSGVAGKFGDATI